MQLALEKVSESDPEYKMLKEYDTLSKEVNKKADKQKNYDIYVQRLSCFSEVISNACGIEIHNRNDEGYKPDHTLKNVFVLASAFDNGNSIIPVKLEVKEFWDKANRLYIAVSLEGIEKDRVVGMGVPNSRSHVRTSPVSNISISEIFANINPKDSKFLPKIT